MRLVAAALACLLSLAVPAFAQPFDTPQELLETFYAPYLANEIPENERIFFSKALVDYYEADSENTPDGEMGALDFDPFVEGQDFDIADLDVGEPTIRGDKARVAVTFTNFGEPREIYFELVFEDGSWLIDDLVNTNPAYGYRLTQIFEEAKQYW